MRVVTGADCSARPSACPVDAVLSVETVPLLDPCCVPEPAGAPAAAPVSSAAELPRTGGSARLPALALALLGGAAWVRRRRTA